MEDTEAWIEKVASNGDVPYKRHSHICSLSSSQTMHVPTIIRSIIFLSGPDLRSRHILVSDLRSFADLRSPINIIDGRSEISERSEISKIRAIADFV